ncbi:hypothetical protein PS15m_011691 [Mucor circinelloides]
MNLQVHSGTLYKIYGTCNQSPYSTELQSQANFNHLLLPYAHLFDRIEVSNDFNESTKIDGLGILKGSREILLIIEFAGGNTSSMAKYDSDSRQFDLL